MIGENKINLTRGFMYERLSDVVLEVEDEQLVNSVAMGDLREIVSEIIRVFDTPYIITQLFAEGYGTYSGYLSEGLLKHKESAPVMLAMLYYLNSMDSKMWLNGRHSEKLLDDELARNFVKGFEKESIDTLKETYKENQAALETLMLAIGHFGNRAVSYACKNPRAEVIYPEYLIDSVAKTFAEDPIKKLAQTYSGKRFNLFMENILRAVDMLLIHNHYNPSDYNMVGDVITNIASSLTEEDLNPYLDKIDGLTNEEDALFMLGRVAYHSQDAEYVKKAAQVAVYYQCRDSSHLGLHLNSFRGEVSRNGVPIEDKKQELMRSLNRTLNL